MQKKLQVLVLATVAAGFVLVPTRDAEAISLSGWLTSIGRGSVITRVTDAFNTAITNATNSGQTTRANTLTFALGIFTQIVNFDPQAPTST